MLWEKIAYLHYKNKNYDFELTGNWNHLYDSKNSIEHFMNVTSTNYGMVISIHTEETMMFLKDKFDETHLYYTEPWIKVIKEWTKVSYRGLQGWKKVVERDMDDMTLETVIILLSANNSNQIMETRLTSQEGSVKSMMKNPDVYTFINSLKAANWE